MRCSVLGILIDKGVAARINDVNESRGLLARLPQYTRSKERIGTQGNGNMNHHETTGESGAIIKTTTYYVDLETGLLIAESASMTVYAQPVE